MHPEQPLVDRFALELDRLVAPGAMIGVAVSGGPDSIALLLLAAAARPGRVEAATVDHALRSESRAEAESVASLCLSLAVPHSILTAGWEVKPESAIQERARVERYRLLARWAHERRLDALLTAHHADDQAETFLMRLARGVGVTGLSAMRPATRIDGDLLLVRPLLGWRRSELEAIGAAAGASPVHDPSNEDEQFERVRIRKALIEASWLDPGSIAASAAHLSEADSALDWAAEVEWSRSVSEHADELIYRPADGPGEIRRRIVRRAILALATENAGSELRGREIGRVMDSLAAGCRTTLRGVVCTGGLEWRFGRAPERRPTAASESVEIASIEGK